MKRIIQKILQHDVLREQPPVLIDIGASGGLPPEWKLLAPHSIGVAFDADTRDFRLDESAAHGWKKLYTLNRLVAEQDSEAVAFYLTNSPYCSSALRPDSAALSPWAFCRLFAVDRVAQMPATTLSTALSKIGITNIDWYKSDTQGTDLRLFKTLPPPLLDRILVAEFEPGIINAYIGEDKLHHLLAYMEARPFWVSDMRIKGSQRISQTALASLNWCQRRSPGSFLMDSPGWCEISYLNTLENEGHTLRDYLLAWVCATLKKQHGFALHLAVTGQEKFRTSLFGELHNASRRRLSGGYAKLGIKAIKLLLRR